MRWLVVGAVGLGLVAVAVLALTYGRRITRELDDERAPFLKPLEGEYVTVVVGDYMGVWRTLTGHLSWEPRSTEAPPSRLAITLPNGRQKWFQAGLLREIRDAQTGARIGGPW